MFTGIIECIGNVATIEKSGTNLRFLINSPISKELKIDQSVSHNGVCLTIESLTHNGHWITAIAETLQKTKSLYHSIQKLLSLDDSIIVLPSHTNKPVDFDGKPIQSTIVLTCLWHRE